MKSAVPKKDKAIGIRLPLETYEALKARADAERRSLSNFILLLIERDLQNFKTATAIPEKLDVLDAIAPVSRPDTRARIEEVMREANGAKLEKLKQLLAESFMDGAMSRALNEPPPPPYQTKDQRES